MLIFELISAVAATPLCPNGPPDKEVLCNACGSRWRTKGTLPNHTPMHSGGSEGWASPEVSALGHGNSCSSEYRSSKRKEPSGGHLQLGPIRKFAGNDSTSASSLSSYISDSDEDANGLSSPVRSDTAGWLICLKNLILLVVEYAWMVILLTVVLSEVVLSVSTVRVMFEPL